MTFTQPERGFEAAYFGECGGCEDRIQPGDRVEYRDGFVCHVECKEVALPTFNSVCPDCFMERSTSGACGCES